MIKNFSQFVLTENKNDIQDLILVDIRTHSNTYSSIDKKCYFGPDKNLKPLISKIIKEYIDNNIFKHSNEIIEHDGTIYNVITFTFAPEWKPRSTGWGKEEISKQRKELDVFAKFIDGKSPIYEAWLDNDIKNKKLEIEKKRKAEGYVLWKQYPDEHENKDYVGGFNLETFFKECLISYVEKGLVFGYIGHNCRKVWVDKLLAKICLPVIKEDDFACWLTSTSGRHFGDHIEEMVEKDDQKGVENYIKKRLPIIHDEAIIYNSPEHKGNLKSSIDLWDKFNNIGMMMSKNNPKNI